MTSVTTAALSDALPSSVPKLEASGLNWAIFLVMSMGYPWLNFSISMPLPAHTLTRTHGSAFQMKAHENSIFYGVTKCARGPPPHSPPQGHIMVGGDFVISIAIGVGEVQHFVGIVPMCLDITGNHPTSQWLPTFLFACLGHMSENGVPLREDNCS